MREYVIRNGSMYSGAHYLYENLDEFRKEIPSDKIKLFKWGKDDFKEYTAGDYVVAEDGYVTQILPVKDISRSPVRIR